MSQTNKELNVIKTVGFIHTSLGLMQELCVGIEQRNRVLAIGKPNNYTKICGLESDTSIFSDRPPDSVDLLSYITNVGYFGEVHCSQICYQILKGMQLLHSNNVCFGHLSPECIYLENISTAL
jgi:serine/threonine protein kinase